MISREKNIKRKCYEKDGICYIPLPDGKTEAMCDVEFINEVNKHSWRFGFNKNVTTSYSNSTIQLSNFILGIEALKNKKQRTREEKGLFRIKYINGNKLDNRLCNLKRYMCNVSVKVNRKRDIAHKKHGLSSIYRGVYLKNGLFVAYAKKKYIGYFKNEIDAAKARDIFILKKNLGLALNFPIETYGKTFTKKSKKLSKFIGVYLHKKSGRFTAYVTILKKLKYIGMFKEEYSAAHARDLYIIKNKLNLELNFPIETYEHELRN